MNTAELLPGTRASRTGESPGWLWSSLNGKVRVELIIVGIFVLLAASPLLLHRDATVPSSDILSPPSAACWSGTTQTGQDVRAHQAMVKRYIAKYSQNLA